ncbi:LysR family transcriptional regulator [Altererythrobacter sp.]|nr:LysR family transcriptional regulator [Altererythrobacter sp.]
MDHNGINWTYWRTFLWVTELGSLSAAARHLSLTQPTVGRHIGLLEDALAKPLFTRSQDGLVATEFAHALLPEAKAMSAAAEALHRRSASDSDKLSGTVRISASEIVGTELLPAILHSFHKQSSGIKIELALSNQQDDLLNRDADIAVRMVRPTQKRLVARKVGDIFVGLFAHRSYVDQYGTPKTTAELADHDQIGIDRDLDRWKRFFEAEASIPPADLSFRCDSDIGQLAMLRAGLGIGACQKNIARNEPDLVAILADDISIVFDVWLVMHEDLKTDIAARLLFDHLSAQFPKVIAD